MVEANFESKERDQPRMSLSVVQATDDVRPLSSDEAFLATLGYRQEFRREFSTVEVFGLVFSSIGVLPSIAYVSCVGRLLSSEAHLNLVLQ